MESKFEIKITRLLSNEIISDQYLDQAQTHPIKKIFGVHIIENVSLNNNLIAAEINL